MKIHRKYQYEDYQEYGDTTQRKVTLEEMTRYCCGEMSREVQCGTIETIHRVVIDRGQLQINFCPFCGARIEIVEEDVTKGTDQTT